MRRACHFHSNNVKMDSSSLSDCLPELRGVNFHSGGIPKHDCRQAKGGYGARDPSCADLRAHENRPRDANSFRQRLSDRTVPRFRRALGHFAFSVADQQAINRGNAERELPRLKT